MKLNMQYNTHLILNSQHKTIITIIIYCFIYFCFYGDNMVALCMNENIQSTEIPSIAESKSTITRSVIQREVSAFVGFSETIEQQKTLIEEQAKTISEYKKELAFNQDMLRLIAGDDHVADAISDRGLKPYINKICEKHKKPLWYPPFDY